MKHDEAPHQEIIIIKRVIAEEEGHHGGAWKIAFADFMTAMMALFLVLWLINAANEETKRAVASYFNPVKLVDRNRSSKGINDQRGGPTSEPYNNEKAEPPKEPSETKPDLSEQELLQKSEDEFLSNPMEQLSAIEKTALGAQPAGGETPLLQTELASDTFADPFSQDFLNQGKLNQNKTEAETEQSEPPLPAERASNVKPDEIELSSIEKQVDAEPKPNVAEAIANALKSEIRSELEAKTTDAEQIASMVEVKVTEDGILISVTDTLGHPMFEVGSAIPAAPIVLAVDAIAKTLNTKSGPIHVFGHTDARQYRNEADGNWTLSTDRARATYFMLLHGGLPDNRIVEIAGFADRKPRVPADTFADENRRIEILLGSE